MQFQPERMEERLSRVLVVGKPVENGIQIYYDALLHGIVDPDAFADQLIKCRVVHPELANEVQTKTGLEKNAAIIDSVVDSLRTEPIKFHMFLTVLNTSFKAVPTGNSLARKIKICE